jgi:3-phosphoglycerate kinase
VEALDRARTCGILFLHLTSTPLEKRSIDHLDESGIRDAVSVIRNLTKEFDRVIVISHVSAIREMLQGHMLEVVKNGSEESTVKSFGTSSESTEAIDRSEVGESVLYQIFKWSKYH